MTGLKNNYQRLSLLLLLVCAMTESYVKASYCVGLGQQCKQNCDCCGSDVDPDIQCELRNKNYACYISRPIGGDCTEDQQCKSQSCMDGKCTFKSQIKKDLPFCPLSDEVDYVQPVLGQITEEGCACANPDEPNYTDVIKAIDGDTSTIYANNLAIGSGLEIKPKKNAPLRKIKICSSNDCPECDPTSYKVEGKCHDNNYKFIQEGSISFSTRNECIDIPVSSPNKFYSAYKVTFPSIRGGFPECEVEPCTCPSDPLFEPQASITCPNSEDKQRAGRLQLYSKDYQDGHTTLVYQFANKNYHNENGDLKELNYMILPWEGQCCFDCYDTFFDDEDEIFNPGKDEICYKECPDRTMVRTNDPNLCMQGIKLQNDAIIGSHMYFFELKIKGEVSLKNLQYGIYSDNQYKEYDFVQSPVCPSTSTCTKEPTCKNYPLKISEMSMLGKCNEFETNSATTMSRFLKGGNKSKFTC